MRIATWNVNSIRVREATVEQWLIANRPDVLCIQETKVEEDGFPRARFEALGYRCAVSGQRTYNGVAILAREEPQDVVRGFADGIDEDPQRRLVRATVGGVRVVNAYCPNGEDTTSPKYEYKLGWFKRLRAALDAQEDAKRPFVIVGDFNVAPEPIDVHAPERWEGKVLCSEPERAALRDLRAFGLADCLRKLRPDEPKVFTWWDYRLAAFQRGWGLRIDHVLASDALASRCTAVTVDVETRRAEKPSDHAPVTADFA